MPQHCDFNQSSSHQNAFSFGIDSPNYHVLIDNGVSIKNTE